MKFRLSKDVLLDGLMQVTSVVSNRATLPVLSNVLLSADDGLLRITANDLDTGITTTVPANVELPGSVTLPAKKLLSIVRELPSAEVSVNVDEKSTATVRCSRSLFKLLGIPANEFPSFPSFEESRRFKVPQGILKEAIKRTEYAIAPDDSHYVLGGLFMSFKDGKMSLVATDGRRLAMVQHELEFPESQSTEIILPRKAVNELRRLLGDEGDIIIKFSNNQSSFEINDTQLVSKLIDGVYPNYRQVIPADRKERVMIPREEFLDIIRRVSLLSADKANSVKFTFCSDELKVDANSTELGEAHEPFPIDYHGREMAISFNPEYLMAPLRAIGCDTIAFDLIDEMSPGVIRIDDEFLYVIMPMRVAK